LQKEFYRSILWAEKIGNSRSGVPQEIKESEVVEKVTTDITKWSSQWRDESRKNEKIAFEIYRNCMLKKDISKAITAQVFAEDLHKKNSIPGNSLKDTILDDPSLQYILDAIYHVTKSRE
jgi:putative ATP-dependent endonuclease of OLD family